MRIFRKMMLVAMLCFLASCGAQDTSNLRRLSMANDQFLITFPANPTTGYEWKIISYDQRQLRLLKSQYMTPDKTKMMGAAGKMIYEFEIRDTAVYPVNSIILFQYARPWDQENSIFKTAVITVKKAQQKPSVKIQ